MARRWEALGPQHVGLLVGSCAGCTSWQRPAVEALAPGDGAELKRAWIAEVVDQVGTAGAVLRVDDQPVGVVVLAPPALLPRIDAMPTAPVSPDCLVVVGLQATEPSMYKPLVQRAVKVAREVGVRALEAFGGGPAPRGCLTRPADGSVPCRLPNALLERTGFRVAREHPRSPRYRLDTTSAVPTRETLEHGVVGLARALRPRPVPEPGLSRRP